MFSEISSLCKQIAMPSDRGNSSVSLQPCPMCLDGNKFQHFSDVNANRTATEFNFCMAQQCMAQQCMFCLLPAECQEEHLVGGFHNNKSSVEGVALRPPWCWDIRLGNIEILNDCIYLTKLGIGRLTNLSSYLKVRNLASQMWSVFAAGTNSWWLICDQKQLFCHSRYQNQSVKSPSQKITWIGVKCSSRLPTFNKIKLRHSHVLLKNYEC